MQYVEEHWEKAANKWNVITMPHCIQKDGFSCGVYVMKVTIAIYIHALNSLYINICINMQFAECIIKHQPLPVTMHDIYKLRNNMAIELLNASGLFPLYAVHFIIIVRLYACVSSYRIIGELLSCMWNE